MNNTNGNSSTYTTAGNTKTINVVNSNNTSTSTLNVISYNFSIESRNKISDSLKKYHATKIGINPENNGNPTH